jgi:hypothetical protein
VLQCSHRRSLHRTACVIAFRNSEMKNGRKRTRQNRVD